MRHSFATLIALLALVCPVLAQTPPPAAVLHPFEGTAEGNLVADGRSIPLRFAYVVAVDDVEGAGLLASGPRTETVIVLSDRSLPRGCVADRDAPFADLKSPAQAFAAPTQTDVAAMHGILLQIDPVKNAVLSARVLYPGSSAVAFSVEGTQYPDRVTGLTRQGGILSGVASVPSPVLTGSQSAADGPKKYQYRVSFHAPVLTEPAVTQSWEGKAALDSPPVTALRAYLEAGRKGDVTALRALTAAPNLPFLANPDVLKPLKSGDMSLLPQQVRRVVVRGETATIVIVSGKPNYSQVEMHLLREAGAWKLCWP